MMNFASICLILDAAFIKLASVDAAHRAIKDLHNTQLGDRTIIVKSADQDCEYGANLHCRLLGQLPCVVTPCPGAWRKVNCHSMYRQKKVSF
jgi:RNA recognition motif-containing protein